MTVNTAKRMLVVDDEPDLLELIVMELELSGMEVLSARCYEEAIAILKAHRVDCLLSDIRMPGKDGMALLQACKKDYPDTTAILMTGYADVSTELALDAGAIARLDKPFSREELQELLASFERGFPLNVQQESKIKPTRFWKFGADRIKDLNLRIGQGGMSFCHDDWDAAEGDYVSFSIQLEDNKTGLLQGLGRVKWTRPWENKMAYGLSFEKLDSDSVHRIQAWQKQNPTVAFIPAGPSTTA